MKSPAESSNRKTIGLLIVASIAFVSTITALGVLGQSLGLLEIPQSIGTSIRFHWDAFHVLGRGGNPYDLEAQAALQNELGWVGFEPQNYYYPPWVLTALGPLLVFPFAISKLLLFYFNVLALIVIGVCAWQLTTEKPIQFAPCFFASIVSLPGILVINSGHINLIVITGLLTALLALRRRYDLLSGMLLTFAALKPHAIYLIVVALAWLVISERRWRVVAGFGLTFGAAIATALYYQPQVFDYWFAQELSPLAWKTATLGSLLRVAAEFFGVGDTEWIAVTVTGGSLLATICWLLTARPKVSWSKYFVPLAIFSAITLPYGWIYDQSILIPAQVMLLALVYETSNSDELLRRALRVVFYFQMLAFVLATFTTTHHGYVWYPFAFLLLCLFIRKQYICPGSR